jgi:uncharacterized protein
MTLELKKVLKKYEGHPEFLGLSLADASQRGALDNTPLHIAAGRGDVEDIRILVKSGADVNAVGDLGFTPLHCAALAGQTASIVELLALGANAALTNEFDQTALRVAEIGKYKDVVEILKRA